MALSKAAHQGNGWTWRLDEESETAVVKFDDGTTKRISIPKRFLMPHFDFILFHIDTDEEAAQKLCEELKNSFDIKGMKYKDCNKLSNNVIKKVSQGIERSTIIFFYISKSLEYLSEYADECQELKEYNDFKDMAVYELFTSPEKYDCIIPVFPTRKNRFRKIPFGLRHLIGLELGKSDKVNQIEAIFSNSVKMMKKNRKEMQDQNMHVYIQAKIKSGEFTNGSENNTMPNQSFEQQEIRKQKEVQKKELEGHSTIYNINAKTVVIGNENKVINTVNSQSDVEGNYSDGAAMGAEDNEDRTPVEHDASFGAGSAYVDQETKEHDFYRMELVNQDFSAEMTDVHSPATDGTSEVSMVTDALREVSITQRKHAGPHMQPEDGAVQMLATNVSDLDPQSRLTFNVQPSTDESIIHESNKLKQKDLPPTMCHNELGLGVENKSNSHWSVAAADNHNQRINSSVQIPSREVGNLDPQINSNIQMPASEVGSLNPQIDSNIQMPASEVGSLNLQIDSNIQMPASEVGSLNPQIDSNIQMPASEVGSLNPQIDSNIQMPASEVGSLNPQIDSNIQMPASEVGSLNPQIDSNIQMPASEVGSLNLQIDSNIQMPASEVGSLNPQIDSNIQMPASEVGSLNPQIDSNIQMPASEVGSLNPQIDSNIQMPASEVGSLNPQIDSNIQMPASEVGSLNPQIDSNIQMSASEVGSLNQQGTLSSCESLYEDCVSEQTMSVREVPPEGTPV